MDQQRLLAAIPGLHSSSLDARSSATLVLLRSQVPAAGALLTYVDRATGVHKVLASEGYRAPVVSYLTGDFIDSDPGFGTVAANPDKLLSWDDIPSYRDTFSPREVFTPVGFHEGASVLLRGEDGATVGTLHLNIRESSFSAPLKELLTVLRPVVSELAALASERSGMELTPRETEILGHIVQGKSNGKIAEELYLSRRTVSTHVEHILCKLGAANRVDAAVRALRLSLCPGLGSR